MLLAILLRVIQNLLGYLSIVIGLILLVTPGPGIVFLLLGMALADWPAKKRFFTWLQRFAWFRTADEWVHRKWGFHLPGNLPEESRQGKGGESASVEPVSAMDER
ncbi:hypothetical protein Pan216_38750 [Planctomycetes bacterium Pan216]|uniref:Transmembrane protein (PGPGW) n=2 Tax=Kolteria novifilia TaxID=2527975 RepID=A0A518B7Q8_9BACT|nr:hypothetical protein Pan216_38750 [Planctomycetes bacterium Pan216]